MSLSKTLPLILTISLFTFITPVEEITVYIRQKNDNSWVIETEKSSLYTYVAEGSYKASIVETGWDTLAIKTNEMYSDQAQAEAAGRLEGYLTRERIYSHYTNIKDFFKINDTIKDFLDEQENFVVNSYLNNTENDIFYVAYLLHLQKKGIRDAYNENVEEEKKISNRDFHYIMSHADLFDLLDKFNQPNFDKMSEKDFLYYIRERSHCSAMFKITYDLKDIFLGHNSWYRYAFATRIIKEMNLNFNHPKIKTKNIIMSSYPAALFSMDDFYVTSQNLAIIETTNHYFNNELYDNIVPESLLCWERVMIANRLSTTAKQWTEIFKQYNSGTYNNQYMILDMKKHNSEIGKLENEAFFVVDQLPGHVGVNDATDQLKFGYWPSYNIPYDKEIYKYAKIEETIEKNPSLLNSTDYNTCARAKIMRRDHNKIKTLEDFKSFIRYNDYMNDEFSNGKTDLTIACRNDLNLDSPYCGGAYDAKALSVKDFMSGKKMIHAVSGPTRNDKIPQFNWGNSTACKDVGHMGLPDVPAFDWIDYNHKYDF